MPAEPIEFRIVQSLQTALKGIKTTDGYHYTVKGWAVKLDPDHQVEDLIPGATDPIGPPRPFFILELPPDTFSYPERANQTLVSVPYIVHAIHEADVVEDNAKLQTFYRLCADIEKAVAIDITRGGLAYDTRILNRRQRERERGGSEVWAQVSGEIRNHRGYGVPNG